MDKIVDGRQKGAKEVIWAMRTRKIFQWTKGSAAKVVFKKATLYLGDESRYNKCHIDISGVILYL